ncbi:ceramide kinase isoform X1 [Patella vulgata]|uniref:ceramide kinase isoform X1 n=1 Tax=Patella vulgata TaxID=6465 RepID=UPI0021809A17|nr:ceramide kinase isoform X1 [Patella vulgata]
MQEEGHFVSESKPVKLWLNDQGVNWIVDKIQVSIPYINIIGVKKESETDVEVEKHSTFSLHFIQKPKTNDQNHILLRSNKIFSCKGNCADLIKKITDRCKQGKAGNLLVIINPIGGCGNAEQIYHDVVKPLFNLAAIETTVMVSDYPKHVEEMGKKTDFNLYDGIVIMGGDGTLQELMHSLLRRIQKAEGVCLNNPETELHSLNIPIGMIPTGTGNGLAGGCYKTKDIVTSVLHIIRGATRPTNIVSIYENDRLVSFASVIIGYGYFLDLTSKTDNMRWLGSLRHPVGLIKSLFSKQRLFKAEIEYHPAEDTKPHGRAPYRSGTDLKETDLNSEWKKIEPEIMGFNVYPGVFRCVNESFDFDLSSSGFTLQLEKHTSLWTYFQYLMAMKDFQVEFMEFDFCDFVMVDAVRIKLTNIGELDKCDIALEHKIHFDGENRTIHTKQFDIRLHKNLIRVYSSCDSTI